MLRAAAGGRITVYGFMSPDEQYRAAAYLKKDAEDCFFVFFGGYAVRKAKGCLFFPLFYAGDEEVCRRFTAAAIQAVNIRGSGYERLTHRSFMGRCSRPELNVIQATLSCAMNMTTLFYAMKKLPDI